MDTQPPQPGTAVLDVLVERHRALLDGRGERVTREQALGRLLAAYLRFSRGRVLAACAEALREAGLREDADALGNVPTRDDHAPAR